MHMCYYWALLVIMLRWCWIANCLFLLNVVVLFLLLYMFFFFNMELYSAVLARTPLKKRFWISMGLFPGKIKVKKKKTLINHSTTLIKTTCWISNWASEWERQVNRVTLNVSWLLVADGGSEYFRNCWSTGIFTHNNGEKRKYQLAAVLWAKMPCWC